MSKHSTTIMTVASALLSTLLLTACTEEDGKWDPMKWKTDVVTVKENGTKFTHVPKEGGTYEYTCQNYKGFWIENVKESKSFGGPVTIYYPYDNTEHPSEAWKSDFETLASHVRVKENKLSVTIKPNDKETDRCVVVEVSAGDTGWTFKYKQDGK